MVLIFAPPPPYTASFLINAWAFITAFTVLQYDMWRAKHHWPPVAYSALEIAMACHNKWNKVVYTFVPSYMSPLLFRSGNVMDPFQGSNLGFLSFFLVDRKADRIFCPAENFFCPVVVGIGHFCIHLRFLATSLGQNLISITTSIWQVVSKTGYLTLRTMCQDR